MAMDDGAEIGRAAKEYCWTFSNVEFDEGRWQLRVAGQAVELERKPLEVLQYLLRHAGEAVTKEEVLASAWAGRIVVEAVLTNAIGKLRKALGDDAQEIVATLPKVGYRLSVPVSRKPVEFIPEASRLAMGDAVPRRPNWKLDTPLARTDGSEVWLARHAKTRETRVFKFSLAGKGLHGLKREVTIARLLREALGERGDFVQVIDWDFEEAPYFVESDYGGVSLDHWPEDGGIADVPLERRLALFVQAADAVAAAHGIGVLHKDLKPANLLVHGDGDDAQLRVADFGSSRLFDSGRLDELGITHLGLTQTQAISSDSGTPLYLAPEVVGGQSASIKSDVYALGVTLYQLLVGDFRRPLSPGWEVDIADPLLRQDIADAANGDPAKRIDSAAMLAERIRTLETRREKRALELAVQARVAEGEKRLAKARARRPWMIAAVVALVSGLAISGYMWRQSEEQARATAAQRDIAQALNEFVSHDILGAANPMQTGNASISIREALDRASPKIDTRFSAQPEIAAPLHATVARAYYQLSDYAAANRHFRESASLFAKESGAESADVLGQRTQLAESLARAGDIGSAKLELAWLKPRVSKLDPEHRARAMVRYDLAEAWTRWESGNLADAVQPMQDAASNLALLPEPDVELELEVRQALIMARSQAGLPVADIVKLQRASIEKLQSSRNGNKLPLLMSAQYGLLRARLLTSEASSLEPEYRGMIAELTERLGPLNEATLLAKHGLSYIYMKQQKWPECERLLAVAHADLVRLLGPSNIHSVNAGNTYGACLLGEGRTKEAVHMLRGALDALKRDGVKAGLVRVAVQINLGHALADMGQWDELAQVLQQITTNGAKLLKADSDAAGEVYLLEGRLSFARGDDEAARMQLRESITELEKKNQDDYWLIQIGKRELAKVAAKTIH